MNLTRLMAAALLTVPTLALAVPITYVFTGNFGTPEQGCWMRAGPDVCNQELFGYFTIDNEPISADATFAKYYSAGGPYGMYLQVGGQTGWNSTVGLDLFHKSPLFYLEESDAVFFHTGSGPTGDGYSDATLRFASWWLNGSGNAFDGPPRIPPMPDPNDFGNVCNEALEGCYITIGQSVVNPFNIYDLTFFRSPVVIPIPVTEPGTLALIAISLGSVGFVRRKAKRKVSNALG